MSVIYGVWVEGPAVESDDGSKEWYLEGKRHRSDGPAVERADSILMEGRCGVFIINSIERTDQQLNIHVGIRSGIITDSFIERTVHQWN